MFSNLLIGVDGLDGGRDAIALGRKLVGSGGALTLAHVYDVHGGRSRAAQAAARAGGIVQKARLEADLDADVRPIRSAAAGNGLHALADEIGADLIVVGASRRGLKGRRVLADHTREALDGASCALAVAPSGYGKRSGPLRTIGLGYDGSEESAHALAVARALAAQHDAQLSALDVVQLPAYVGAVYVSDPERTPIDELVEEAQDRLAALGGLVAHAVYGDPAGELAEFGASVDLLVVGSRSFGPLRRLVYGSTSRRLVQVARCPLLVLTRAAKDSLAAPIGPGDAGRPARAGHQG
ncbi:MAG TPA: universal stress protein [Solirubrobacteraceae bacterium]|nr:universal stress protein [Solirubrobacteraceae bacterium]